MAALREDGALHGEPALGHLESGRTGKEAWGKGILGGAPEGWGATAGSSGEGPGGHGILKLPKVRLEVLERGKLVWGGGGRTETYGADGFGLAVPELGQERAARMWVLM